MKTYRVDRWSRGLGISLIVAVLCSGGWLALGSGTNGDTEVLRKTSAAFVKVSQQAMPAVVFISVEKTISLGGGTLQFQAPQGMSPDELWQRFFFGGQGQMPRQRQFRQSGQGSGFLVSKDGYILTNNHVVGDADRIRVKLHDGREFDARRIGSDPRTEVAVIKIDGDDFPYLELGDSDAIEVGEWVIAIGNPFGLSETVTVGVVSAKGRSGIGITDYEDFIQTDAAINPGNSGGPLLNIDSKVIGINTAIYSRSGGYMGIGFAVPANMAERIREQLVRDGKVSRGYLGVFIQDVTPEIAGSFGLEDARGILVADVEKDSPAEKAGLKTDDVILDLNGVPVTSTTAFRNQISSEPPGTVIELKLLSNGAPRKIKVTLGTLPGDVETAAVLQDEDIMEQLGLSVQDLTPELAQRFGYTVGEGVIVAEVTPDGGAARQGIEPGQLITSVNRQPVPDGDAFRKAIAAADNPDSILLRVKMDRRSRYVVISLERAKPQDDERDP